MAYIEDMDSNRTSNHSLEQIVERETALQGQEDAAKKRAEANVKAAHEAAQKILDDGAAEARMLGEKARERIRVEADQKLAALAAQGERQRSELRERLSANIPATIDCIVGALSSAGKGARGR